MTEPYYVLEIEYEDGEVETLEIADAEAVLGRSRKRADFQIADAKASGRHCVLRFRDGGVTVEDLGSTNGTHRNGRQQAGEFGLAVGESFGIGDARIFLAEVIGTELALEETVDKTRALDPEVLAKLRGDLGVGPAPAARPEPAPSVPRPAPVETRHDRLYKRDSSGFDDAATSDGSALRLESPRPVAVAQPRDPDATQAFDRASIEFGEFDTSWDPNQAATPQARAQNPGRPVAQPVFEDDEEDVPGRRGRGLVGWLGLLMVVVWAGIAAALFVRPPAPDLKLVALQDAHPASPLMKLAEVSWRFPNREYWLPELLGGERYRILKHRYGVASTEYRILLDKNATRSEKRDAAEALTEAVEWIKEDGSSLAEKMDTIRIGLWVAAGLAALSGLLLFFGFRRTGGVLMLLGAGAPLLITQPAPWEPLMLTGVLALLGIAAFISHWVGRRA